MLSKSAEEFDIIISGAGPAGSTCAMCLAKQGRKVLLLERKKFPRDKVCADNKTWKCLDIIHELGLWKEFSKLPKKEITAVLTASPSGYEVTTTLAEEDVKKKGTWFNVRRKVFDNFLAMSAKKNKNITLIENAEVLAPIISEGKTVGVTYTHKNKKKQARAKVVIGADGSNSVIAKSVGLTPVIKGRYAMNCRAYFKGIKGTKNACELYYLKGICPGYFWIFPVDGGMCNVGVGMRVEDIRKQGINLEEKIEELIHSEKFRERFLRAKRVSDYGQWGVSVLPGKRKWSGEGFVLIGDAGAFAMTFSGEGVGPAMRSGKTAAEALESAFKENDFSAKSLKRFDEKMWKILKEEVKGFKWLEFLILNEALFDYVWKRTPKHKDLMRIGSLMQNDYTLSQKLVHPGTVLKLIFS